MHISDKLWLGEQLGISDDAMVTNGYVRQLVYPFPRSCSLPLPRSISLPLPRSFKARFQTLPTRFKTGAVE